jgi:hypothetical protein
MTRVQAFAPIEWISRSRTFGFAHSKGAFNSIHRQIIVPASMTIKNPDATGRKLE